MTGAYKGPNPDYDPGIMTPCGRPRRKATGRRGIIQMIDTLLSEEGGREKLRQAFSQSLDTSPLEFYRDVVRPLIPLSMLEDEKGGTDDKAQEIREALREMEEATAQQTAAAQAAAAAQAKVKEQAAKLATLTGKMPQVLQTPQTDGITVNPPLP